MKVMIIQLSPVKKINEGMIDILAFFIYKYIVLVLLSLYITYIFPSLDYPALYYTQHNVNEQSRFETGRNIKEFKVWLCPNYGHISVGGHWNVCWGNEHVPCFCCSRAKLQVCSLDVKV